MGNVTNLGNGLTIANGLADIEFYDGTGVWGFRYTALAKLTTKRGDGFAGQIASGGQNYDDATPFKRKVYDNFLGGFGQMSDNKVSGGVGIGGDDTKYFYADATTDRAGYVLPGPSRNFIYNSYAAAKLPVVGDADPSPGDEYEVPRGVMPCALSSQYYVHNAFTTTAAAIVGVTNIRALINIVDINITAAQTLRCAVYKNTVLQTTFTVSVIPSTQYINGWAWINYTAAAFTFAANTNYDLFFYCDSANYPPYFAIGCYSNLASNGAFGSAASYLNPIRPYFQICKPGTATPYKYWSGALRKVHQLLDGTAYLNVAVCSTAWFNTGALATGGTAANNPEVALTGTYTGSIVWNNKLYVATTSGLTAWAAALCHINTAAPTNALDATGASMVSLVSGYGNIYYVDATQNRINKFTGNFPVNTNISQVVAANTIGDATTAITKIFFYQGNLWAAKPEGLFLLYADPQLMGSSVTYTPRITPMGDPFPTPHQAAGAYTVIHQGTIYTNYKDRLYAVTVSATGTQVAIATVPMPWYTLGNYHQIDGIASDGINLYVSFNNLGVFKYANQTWHPVTEFYETISNEPTNSGLTWVANPSGGADNLYVRDGFSLVQMPIPNAASPFTKQIRLKDQNKCGYLMTSSTNMEAAEMIKYIRSVILTAFPSYYRFKIVPAGLRSPNYASSYGGISGFSTILNSTWAEGLIRDNWVNATDLHRTLATNNTDASGLADIWIANNTLTPFFGIPAPADGKPQTGATAPTCWDWTDFAGTNYSSEKNSYAGQVAQPTDLQDAVLHPAKFVQTSFIIYYWCPYINQASSSLDPMVLDSIVVKYQTIQDFLALYTISLGIDELTKGRGTNLSQVDAETTWQWLHTNLTRHSPLVITVKVRGMVDPALDGSLTTGIIPNVATRFFLGFLQNPTEQHGSPIVNLDTLQALPDRVDLSVISADGEVYYNV